MAQSLRARVIELDFAGMEANWTSEEKHDPGHSLEYFIFLANTLYQYYVPVITCSGIVCSLFVVIVLLKSKLRKRYFSHVFVAVYICDIGFLLTILCIWTRDHGLDLYMVPGLCQMVIFASHFFPFLSFWYSISGCIVLFLRGRCHEMNITMFKGPGKARLLILSLCTLATTIFIYKTWTNGVLIVRGTRVCTILPENESVMSILNVFDMVLLLVLPFALFVIFDIWTLVLVISKSVLGARNGNVPVIDRSFRILFIHSILFVLFVGPGCISKLIIIVKLLSNIEFYTLQHLVIENILQYFFYSYFAFKSVLHMIMSKSFRYHAKQLILSLWSYVKMYRKLHASSAMDPTFV